MPDGTLIVTVQELVTSVPLPPPVAKLCVTGLRVIQLEGMGVPPPPFITRVAENVLLFFGAVTASVNESLFPAGILKDAEGVAAYVKFPASVKWTSACIADCAPTAVTSKEAP